MEFLFPESFCVNNNPGGTIALIASIVFAIGPSIIGTEFDESKTIIFLVSKMFTDKLAVRSTALFALLIRLVCLSKQYQRENQSCNFFWDFMDWFQNEIPNYSTDFQL